MADEVLTVRVGREEAVIVNAGQPPCEVTADVRLNESGEVAFEDAAGRVRQHQVPAARGWLHLSVRLHAGLGCQADAVVTSRPTHQAGAALGQDEVGVRFQPFFLAGVQAPDLTGQGLFARGLHFRGLVTPSRVILSCECDRCKRTFLAHSFHTGLAENTYFYSASGLHTLTLDQGMEGVPVSGARVDPVKLHRLEARLPPAPDGSAFAYMNPFRCPHCGTAYIDFAAHPGLREAEYYGLFFPGTPPIQPQP